MRRPKGRVHVSCEPKPEVAQCTLRLSWLKIRPTPREIRMDGITREVMAR
jgi:hypothetical protein